jgi:basic membrane protein A
MLSDFRDGTFRGGREHMFNASINGVGLPMQNARFQSFTQAQYDAIYAQLASGAIRVNNSLEVADILGGISLVVVNQM